MPFVQCFRRPAMLVALALLVASAASAASPTRVVKAHGIRLTIPRGWTRVAPASTGVVDPRTLLVVGTRGVAPKPGLCQIAAYRIPAAGAVVVVVGWTSLRESGASGARPGRRPLAKLVRVHRPSFECFGGRGAAAGLVLGGRAYQVNVLVGARATRSVIEQALAVGRSFDLATP